MSFSNNLLTLTYLIIFDDITKDDRQVKNWSFKTNGVKILEVTGETGVSEGFSEILSRSNLRTTCRVGVGKLA